MNVNNILIKIMQENYDFSKGNRGAVIPTPSNKIKVNLTLDKEIIDWFQAKVNELEGGDYHQLINHVLQDYIKKEEKALRSISNVG